MWKFLCALFLLKISLIESKRNVVVSLPGSCSISRQREIDGAVLVSRYNSLYQRRDCVQKYKGDEKYGRMQVQVRRLSITNCNTVLTISDSQHTRTYDCRSLATNYNWKTYNRYVTVRLSNGGNKEKFQIILTSIPSSSSFKCEFRCRSSGYCIDRDLRCDGYSHCLKGEDEQDCSHRGRSLRGSSTAGIVIGLIILVIIVVVIVALCIRRRRQAHYVGRTVVTTQPAYPAQPMVPPAGAAYPAYGGQEMKAAPGYGGGWTGAMPPAYSPQAQGVAPYPPQMATGPQYQMAAPYPQQMAPGAAPPYPQQSAPPYPTQPVPQQPTQPLPQYPSQPSVPPPYPASETASAPPPPPN